MAWHDQYHRLEYAPVGDFVAEPMGGHQRITIAACFQCPFFGEHTYRCSLADRRMPTQFNAPAWCPLRERPVLVSLSVSR